ncbi:hypothetical protein CRENBAI_007592 [Crenichthys baileyi]|uniref:Mixed lineage kinase domain-containing protein n=1 Tax=Crenichthys baileyi TaxID=28760 RepID=A0AAV9S7W8_9TELE
MDYIEPILSIASQIYTLVENVKANKKRCYRVVERVKVLESLVKSIKQRDAFEHSAEVEKALKGLSITLKSAQGLIEKYTLANLVKRILKSNSHGDEFNSVNERLNDAFQSLALALELENGNQVFKVFQLISRHKEDEEDRREDDAELKRMLLEYGEYVETMQRELEDIKSSSSPKLPEKERPTGPRTLIVGNTAVNGIKNLCNKKNTEVMIGTSNVVSDVSENILAITEKRPTLENLIIHCGTIDDVAKKKSEGLKEDFTCLLNKVGVLNIKVFSADPLHRFSGEMRFS